MRVSTERSGYSIFWVEHWKSQAGRRSTVKRHLAQSWFIDHDQVRDRSSHSQSSHGIDLAGAARRNIAGRKSRQKEEYCDHDEGRGIGGADPEEQSLHHSRQGEGPTETEGDS